MQFVATERWHLEYMHPDARPNICEDSRGITALSGNVPVAICIMDNWSFNSCMMHIWIGNPMVLRHGFAEEVFGFVFNSGRTKVIGITPSDNQRALKFNRHIGFKEIFRIKDGYKHGVDHVITEMNKSECRFINGQKVSTGSTRLYGGSKTARAGKQGHRVPERRPQ